MGSPIIQRRRGTWSMVGSRAMTNAGHRWCRRSSSAHGGSNGSVPSRMGLGLLLCRQSASLTSTKLQRRLWKCHAFPSEPAGPSSSSSSRPSHLHRRRHHRPERRLSTKSPSSPLFAEALLSEGEDERCDSYATDSTWAVQHL